MTDRLPIDFFNTEALNLTGAAVIVTGSSRGIGKAIALALAAEGANVLVNFTNDRSQEAADAVAAAISALGCKSAVVQADIGDPAARETILQAAIDAFGGVDILINNAGITRIADAPDETPEDF